MDQLPRSSCGASTNRNATAQCQARLEIVERRPEPVLRGQGHRREEAVREVYHHGGEAVKTVKEKRPTAKVFIVSDDTHRKLKAYAIKMGYKLQYIADEAVAEYLKRKELK